MKEDNVTKYELFVRTSAANPYNFSFTNPIGSVYSEVRDYYFVWSDQSQNAMPENDFFLPVFLKQTGSLDGYVDIAVNNTLYPIVRQEINPYFIEYKFFDTINRIDINNGGQLTLAMVNFIRDKRTEVSNFDDNQVRAWFDSIGKPELPWFKNTPDQVTIDNIASVSFVNESLISKAIVYPIDINS